jgi:hypothetical protein
MLKARISDGVIFRLPNSDLAMMKERVCKSIFKEEKEQEHRIKTCSFSFPHTI